MSNAARRARRGAAKKARRTARKKRAAGKRRSAPVVLLVPPKKKRKTKKKGHHVAKRKRSRKGAHGAATPRRRKKGHRKGGGGRRRGLMPGKDDIHLFMGAAAYGWAESRARADKEFILNKLPRPIAQLGYTGNTALILWAAGVLTRNKWVQLAARATAAVGIYQLATRGKLYDAGDAQFTLSGYEDDDVAAQLEAAQGAQMGALSPDAGLPDGAFGGGF